jgi:glycerol uptake facilitator-like aquaporin
LTTVQIIANPAITIGRMFSATFAGIAPASVPGFIAAQIIGAGLAVALLLVFYPAITPAEAAEAVLPHQLPAAGVPRERRM